MSVNIHVQEKKVQFIDEEKEKYSMSNKELEEDV